MCEIQSLNRGDCGDVNGGTRVSYWAEYKDLVFTTDADGCVTGIGLATGGALAKFEYDRDNTSRFDQVGEREGKRLRVAQESFMKFDGTSKEKAIAANKSKDCCSVVGIHFQEDCSIYIQGIDFNEKSNAIEESVEPARFTPSIYSRTAAESSGLEFVVNSVAKCFVPADPLLITEASLDALL